MKPKVALCLPGGGVTGAMYQIGALAALEDSIDGFDANGFDLYVGTSSGGTVASSLAGGVAVQRMYRALLDPADVFFPLERRHILRTDLREWARALGTIFGAARHGTASMLSRAPAPTPQALWEELDRFYDSLPAGVFKLEGYERFLEDFFARRGVPNNFRAMPKRLRIMAHDLDSGEPTFFGGAGFDHVSVSRACAASTALPPFFSPVRIRDRFYIDAGAAQVAHLDAALEDGADVIVVVNPMVPVRVATVPTGHGQRASVRDKGYLWVANQAIRIGMHTLLRESVTRLREKHSVAVILIEPEPTDGILFMFSPASFTGRRTMLEYAYRATRERVSGWLAGRDELVSRAGWTSRITPSN
ncbi:MAG TPA: patatin-like phospholipase family protein [Polyangiaceae bacterium]|nr:patatin-like phospholipase family protein [Polyangiaceae bacterium]